LNVGLTVTGQKEFDPKNDILFLSSFIGTKSNVDAREFSKAENQIKEYDKRINALKNQPELLAQFVKSDPEKYVLAQYYNQSVNGQLRQLRQAANQVRVDKNLTIPERKAKIEQIVNMENVIKRKILDNFEMIEKSYR
jgi:flagellar biosynthesis chaperone FliJ